MTDAQYIAQFDKVTDPAEALRVIVGNEHYLGYDPYYKDIRAALMKLAERLAAPNSPNVKEQK